jgi:hypothetical protein
VELSLEGRMREADVGSPSADTGRAISDHRISCPGLIWRRGSQSLMGNFGGSNRSSRWHWHQPRKGRCSDTDDHLSVRANVFRVAPESGHAETEAPCPKCARSGHALFLKLGACLPSSIVPAIVNSNIKSWADAQRQPAPRARWLSSFGRRCGRSGN